MAHALKAIEKGKRVCFMSLVQAQECLFSDCVKRFCKSQKIDFVDRKDNPWMDFIYDDNVTDFEFEIFSNFKLRDYDLICIDEYPEVQQLFLTK